MTNEVDHYDLLLRAMEEGLLVGVNRDDPHSPGTDELRVVYSYDDRTEVMLKRGHEDHVTIKRDRNGDLVLIDPDSLGGRKEDVVTIEILGVGSDPADVSDSQADTIGKSLSELADERREEDLPTMVAAEEPVCRAHDTDEMVQQAAVAVTSDEGEIVSIDSPGDFDDDSLVELPRGSTVILNHPDTTDLDRTLYLEQERLAYPHAINLVVRMMDIPTWILKSSADAYVSGYDGDFDVFRCQFEGYADRLVKLRLDGFGIEEDEDDD